MLTRQTIIAFLRHMSQYLTDFSVQGYPFRRLSGAALARFED